nr:probable magnesium transporter NIPA2 [Ipomoea trifida]
MKAGASGIRAGSGGYSYLLEPYWWAGMLTMIVGEAANFAAYAYAPAILVTPLGALSIIFSIVLHAPLERKMESVKEVMGVKAVGIALKLSVEDSNQFKYFQTWFFTVCVIIFCLLQLNYLNKALDCFNTAVVSPVYYVMFTTLTIVASVIMFKDWDHQTVTQIVTEFCGFITILSGTFLLHKTKDMGGGTKASTVTPDSETTREAPPKSRPEGPEDV